MGEIHEALRAELKNPNTDEKRRQMLVCTVWWMGELLKGVPAQVGQDMNTIMRWIQHAICEKAERDLEEAQ